MNPAGTSTDLPDIKDEALPDPIANYRPLIIGGIVLVHRPIARSVRRKSHRCPPAEDTSAPKRTCIVLAAPAACTKTNRKLREVGFRHRRHFVDCHAPCTPLRIALNGPAESSVMEGGRFLAFGRAMGTRPARVSCGDRLTGLWLWPRFNFLRTRFR